MRKWFAGLILYALIGTMLSAAVSSALDYIYPHTRNQGLIWRTSTAGNLGYVDSGVFSGDGSTVASAQRIDTSAAFPMEFTTSLSWRQPVTNAESTAVFVLAITPTSNTSVAESADTMLVTLQVSADGSNWASVNATQYAVLDPGTSLQFVRVFNTDGLLGPDENSWWGWPMGRLLVQSDSNGQYSGYTRFASHSAD